LLKGVFCSNCCPSYTKTPLPNAELEDLRPTPDLLLEIPLLPDETL